MEEIVSNGLVDDLKEHYLILKERGVIGQEHEEKLDKMISELGEQ